jgi:putative flippase GtrA
VPANLAALVLSTVATTEANRRFTFAGRSVDRTREYLQNVGTVVFYAFYSSAVLVVLGDVVDEPTAVQESGVVAAASVLGGAVRFLVLRNWVFAPHTRRHGAAALLIRPIVAVRRALLATAALSGLLLSTAASCDTGPAAAPAVTTAPAPAVTSGGEGGDDHGGTGGSGGGRRDGDDHGGDG